MEFFIREANALLEEMSDVLLAINEQRYAAEREYSRVKNSALVEHGKSMIPTFARAQAELDAAEAKARWDEQRAAYHYAEDTQKALTTKIYSMLNVNRAVAATYTSHRG
jgi:ribosome-binding ATPase YchF (GTP1/OBG family)